MTPEQISPALFWQLVLFSIMSGAIFSIAFFGGLEILGWIRDSLRTGDFRLIKSRGPRLGGGHR